MRRRSRRGSSTREAQPQFSGDDIGEGQAVFLKYGLMANGSIWGHGAYLGPDYSAEALHRMGECTARGDRAARSTAQPFAALAPAQQAAVRAEAAVALKTNRYDAASGTLQFTDRASRGLTASRSGTGPRYFHDPARNGGLKADLITDPTELRQFTAFVTWAAWASVAARPGENYSYTNNFPYDPSVGNLPIAGALLWSALSLMVLLAGIAAVLLAFGKFDYLGWITRGPHVIRSCCRGSPAAGQKALVKFFVVVALLLLAQTLVGGARRALPRRSGQLLRLSSSSASSPATCCAPGICSWRSSGSRRPMSPRRCSSGGRCAATSRAGSPAARMCCSPPSRW